MQTGPQTISPAKTGAAERYRRRLLNPVLQRAYLLAKLPLAWFAGLRVRHLDAERCQVVVPRGWRTQNPFRSTYFAAQAMAAELTTGALLLQAVEGVGLSISTLLLEVRGSFGKKAAADATFECGDGARITAAVQQAAETGEPVLVEATSVGRMANGDEVATFVVVWSIRRRSAGPGRG